MMQIAFSKTRIYLDSKISDHLRFRLRIRLIRVLFIHFLERG